MATSAVASPGRAGRGTQSSPAVSCQRESERYVDVGAATWSAPAREVGGGLGDRLAAQVGGRQRGTQRLGQQRQHAGPDRPVEVAVRVVGGSVADLHPPPLQG